LSWVKPVKCPPLDYIVKRLEEKHMMARDVYIIEGREARFNVEPILTEAYRLFGRLQRIDESVPPSRSAYEAIINSVPGLVACMHKHFYEEQGKLKNEMYSIEGPGGIGKTSYVWYLTRFIGGVLINDEIDVVVKLKELIENKKWVPILVFDDIASIIGKYWILFRSERKWANLFKVIEYSKDWSGVIIFTAREFSGLAKRFRELSSFRGTMRRVLAGEYIVDIIEWRKGNSKTPYYVDVLWPGLDLPNEEFTDMLEKRRERSLKMIEEIEEEMLLGQLDVPSTSEA